MLRLISALFASMALILSGVSYATEPNWGPLKELVGKRWLQTASSKPMLWHHYEWAKEGDSLLIDGRDSEGYAILGYIYYDQGDGHFYARYVRNEMVSDFQTEVSGDRIVFTGAFDGVAVRHEITRINSRTLQISYWEERLGQWRKLREYGYLYSTQGMIESLPWEGRKPVSAEEAEAARTAALDKGAGIFKRIWVTVTDNAIEGVGEGVKEGTKDAVYKRITGERRSD